MEASMSGTSVLVEQHRCKVMFEGLDIPSRYYILGADPYGTLRGKIRQCYKDYGLSRRFFLLLWIDVDGDEILLDGEEALLAAFSCVAVDQSGFQILRILARHSSTVLPDNTISTVNTGSALGTGSTVNTVSAVNTVSTGSTVSTVSALGASSAVSGRGLSSQKEFAVQEELSAKGVEELPENFIPLAPESHSVVDASNSSRHSVGKREAVSPEISKGAETGGGGLECGHCGRSFPRKSSFTFHVRKCGLITTTTPVSSKRKRGGRQVSRKVSKKSQDEPNSATSATLATSATHDGSEEIGQHDSSLENKGGGTGEEVFVGGDGVGGWLCGVCGRQFKGRPQRTKHQKDCKGAALVVTEPRQFLSPQKGAYCVPGCGKQYASRTNVKRHQQTCPAHIASFAE